MANSRLTVNISRELVFSIAVIGNEKLQSAYLLEMMPWNHSLNTPLSSCTTPFGAWVSLNHWTALWNMIACQSLALIRDWSMSTARVPYQHIRQSDHLFWDKRSHPPESACVRDILGRSYNKELQRFSLPSPQASLLRAAHSSRSRDTKKPNSRTHEKKYICKRHWKYRHTLLYFFLLQTHSCLDQAELQIRLLHPPNHLKARQ